MKKITEDDLEKRVEVMLYTNTFSSNLRHSGLNILDVMNKGFGCNKVEAVVTQPDEDTLKWGEPLKSLISRINNLAMKLVDQLRGKEGLTIFSKEWLECSVLLHIVSYLLGTFIGRAEGDIQKEAQQVLNLVRLEWVTTLNSLMEDLDRSFTRKDPQTNFEDLQEVVMMASKDLAESTRISGCPESSNQCHIWLLED